MCVCVCVNTGANGCMHVFGVYCRPNQGLMKRSRQKARQMTNCYTALSPKICCCIRRSKQVFAASLSTHAPATLVHVCLLLPSCTFACMSTLACIGGVFCHVCSLLAGEENSKNLASVPERLAAGQRWHTMLSVCAELPGSPPRCPHDSVDVIYNDERWFSHKEDACVTPTQWNACIASLSGDESEGIMKCWDRIFAVTTPTTCFGLVRHDVMWTLVATSDEHPLVKQQETIFGDISDISLPGHHGPRLSVSGGLGNLNGILSVQKLIQKAYSYTRSSQKSTYRGSR